VVAFAAISTAIEVQNWFNRVGTWQAWL